MYIALCKADADLSKVISFEKRQELYNILHSEDPDHYSRLWLVGFLKFCGYSADEICAVVHAEACWSDYDTRTTWCQVNSVFRTSGRTATANKQCSGSGNNAVDRKKDLLSKCVAEVPCSDSIDGFCYLASGNYNIPSADEKTRRALNCFMDHQIAKFQRSCSRSGSNLLMLVLMLVLILMFKLLL